MNFSYQYGPHSEPQILVRGEAGNILLSLIDNQSCQVIEQSPRLTQRQVAAMAMEAARWRRRFNIAEHDH